MQKYVKGGTQCAHPGPNRVENGNQSIQSEAFIPGNGQEREFLLTPGAAQNTCNIAFLQTNY